MKRLLREPLLHFLLVGALLFGAYYFLQAGRPASPSSREIRLTAGEIAQLVQLFRVQWRREPTAQELARLVENKVQAEILYREALAMGLDKDDEMVKRRMAQKMQFLAEDVAAAREPTAAELKAWHQANRAAFAEPARISFRHLYFSPDRRGKRAREDAADALARLAGQPQDAKIARELADRFMFQDVYRDRPPEFLGREFGPQFAQAVAKLPGGSWQGPLESGYGWHLVYVDTLIPGRSPEFEEIEPEVKRAWLAEQKEKAWQKTFQDLRAKYTVFVPAPPN